MRTRRFSEFIALIFAALSFAFSIHAQETNTLSEEQRIGIALEAVSRIQSDIRTNAELKRAVYKLLEKTRGKSASVEIVKKFNLRDHDDGLLEIAIANSSSDFGVEAMRLVLSGGNADLLEKKIAGSDAQTLSKIAEALGNTREKKSVPFLKNIASNSRNDVATRKIAIKSLAQTEEGAGALLVLAKDETFPSELKSAAAMELSSARWPKIKAEAAELLPSLRGENSKVLSPIPELVKIKGNAANGQDVFFSKSRLAPVVIKSTGVARKSGRTSRK